MFNPDTEFLVCKLEPAGEMRRILRSPGIAIEDLMRLLVALLATGVRVKKVKLHAHNKARGETAEVIRCSPRDTNLVLDILLIHTQMPSPNGTQKVVFVQGVRESRMPVPVKEKAAVPA